MQGTGSGTCVGYPPIRGLVAAGSQRWGASSSCSRFVVCPSHVGNMTLLQQQHLHSTIIEEKNGKRQCTHRKSPTRRLCYPVAVQVTSWLRRLPEADKCNKCNNQVGISHACPFDASFLFITVEGNFAPWRYTKYVTSLPLSQGLVKW